ncbi:GumC domain-containing protein [Phytohabitans suffuscus]|uniref:Polysaccharide chain length determinant N-terminal domain-containing protein n=1 Tax=Phytohabitans suffuscus TaxID=624315 RepID=A0A6F8YMM7_9ACTN|nr:hypothetical protein [Phytohabitans suffuscus]BCB87354.1 hypothetical protein Psuf_046670 [Phytohabitans suffuscus]
MDLWDVTKVLWRHKWVALPLLALTVVMAYFVSSSVKPDYKTTGHVTLLPPSEQPAVDPKKAQSPQTVSPWNVYSLADALVIYSARADIKRELSGEGLSEEWVASIGGTQLPIVEIEVVASSEQLAKATLARLIDALTAQLERLQSPYGVQGGEAITLKALDSGQNIQVVTSNVKRTLIVVTAIGLVITLSVVLLLDALLRRREVRRRAGSAGTSGSASVPARRYPTGQPESGETQIIPGKPVRMSKVARARAGVGWPEGDSVPGTNGNGRNGSGKGRVVQSKAAATPPSQPGKPGENGSGHPRRPTGDDVEQTIVISGIGNWSRRESGQQPPEPDGDGKRGNRAPDSGSLPVSEDATTVLPLGRLRWMTPDRDDGKRPPTATPN